MGVAPIAAIPAAPGFPASWALAGACANSPDGQSPGLSKAPGSHSAHLPPQPEPRTRRAQRSPYPPKATALLGLGHAKGCLGTAWDGSCERGAAALLGSGFEKRCHHTAWVGLAK